MLPIFVMALFSAYAAADARAEQAPVVAATAAFSHADFDRVLGRFVDAQGRVDYSGLAADRADLDRYMAQLAAVSPDSQPDLFPSDAARLAYWINAYNAGAIAIVMRSYPIASVRDVRPPAPLFFLPALSGFFYFEKITLGGSAMNLYALENSIIRRRFPEARVHFALNCASAGCPHLPQHAFAPAELDQQLERGARQFVAEPRNLTVDPATKSIDLSSIFNWYEDDFVAAERRAGAASPTVLGYVSRYAPADAAAAIAACRDCRIRFVEYDWRLNDQRRKD